MSGNPFDYVKSIQKTKEDMIRGSDTPELATKEYNPWIVNKALSMYVDSIMYANDMNVNHYLDKDVQYAYHLNSVRAMNRKHTWFKSTSDEDLKVVTNHFQCNNIRALEIMKIIGAKGIDLIKKNDVTGGVVKKR